MFDLNCLVLAGKSSNELVCRFHDITSEDGRKWWIKLGLRSGSTKGEYFLDVLDYEKETTISIGLGSWRIVLASVGLSSDKTHAFFSIFCEDW